MRNTFNKLIFLDVDGVLNSLIWMERMNDAGKNKDGFFFENVDVEAVARLNRIVEATGAAVVVSSTWRIGRSAKELQALLDAHGFVGNVIGKTGNGHDGVRGFQIQ